MNDMISAGARLSGWMYGDGQSGPSVSKKGLILTFSVL
jgi:hypothetical protein